MNITIIDDFDLQKIADSGQCFRAVSFPDGTFRFITGSHVLYIRAAAPGIFEISCSPEEWDSIWHSYFDLDLNYAAIRAAVPPEDAFLHRAAEEGRGIRILRQDHWEMLITFIISQRKTIPAIRQSVELLAECYGVPIKTDRETVRTFPTADALAAADPTGLIDCKLGYRMPYVRDAAFRVVSGETNLTSLEQADDEALLGALQDIHGVGIKVANCVSLFSYHRIGLAPIDTWIRKTIDACCGGRDPFPSYGSTAGILQQYMYYYAQMHRQEINDLLLS